MGYQPPAKEIEQFPIIHDITATSTWAVPSNIKRNQIGQAIVAIDAIASGGGGSGDLTNPGTGGACGQFVQDHLLDLTAYLGTTITITINAAGATGATGANNGGIGGDLVIEDAGSTEFFRLKGGARAEAPTSHSSGEVYPGAAGQIHGGSSNAVSTSNGGRGAIPPFPSHGRGGCGRDSDNSVDYEAQAGMIRFKYFTE